MTCVSFEIVYIGFFVIKNQVNYDSLIDYIYLEIENIAIKIMISLNIRIFAIKMIASLILKIVKIDKNNIYKKMALI